MIRPHATDAGAYPLRRPPEGGCGTRRAPEVRSPGAWHPVRRRRNRHDEEAAGCWAAARMGAPFSGGSPWPTTAPPFMSKATTSES